MIECRIDSTGRGFGPWKSVPTASDFLVEQVRNCSPETYIYYINRRCIFEYRERKSEPMKFDFSDLKKGDRLRITYSDDTTEEVDFLGTVAEALSGTVFVGGVDVSGDIRIDNPDTLVTFMGNDEFGMFLFQPERYKNIERI